MKGYDHVASLFKGAGGPDGQLSRAEAKRLVDQLRKDGRGTEALAAENLFKMIDAQDDAPGARVTAFDLGLSRSFVQKKMLERLDPDANGYSAAEIGKMSPTARGLTELGQLLDLAAKPGRVRHEVPEAGLDHVAALIKNAAGTDGKVSKTERSRLLDSLYKQGRGTEHVAVDQFFKFTDNRTPPASGSVTRAEIDRAAAYARETLLRAKDRNDNGYSKDEIATFSTTAKGFLEVGRLLDAGIIAPAATTGASGATGTTTTTGATGAGARTGPALAREFERLADGLLYTSESDYPYKAFSRPLAPGTPLTEDSFRGALGLAANVPVRFRSAEEFFEGSKDPDSYGPDEIAKYAALEAAMKRDLTDLKFVYVQDDDVVEAPVYLVGRAPDGSIAGLESTRIWT